MDNFRAKGRRFDGAQYRHGTVTRTGILHVLLEGTTIVGDKFRAAVIRRLRPVPSATGNEKVVHEFGHAHYTYDLTNGTGDVKLDCITISNLLRQLPIVPDMFDISQRFSVHFRMCRIPDSIEERKRTHFFVINGFEETTVPEQ
eukprot:IDg1320t1